MEKQIEGFNYLITDDGEVISQYVKGKSICRWVDNVGYLQVNHINGDKRDCSYTNLEWMTNKSNTQHGYDNELYHSKKRCIKIEIYDKNDNYITEYKSIRETAEQLHINRKTLSRILFDNKENNYDYNFKAIL